MPSQTVKEVEPTDPQDDFIFSKKAVSLFLAGQGSGKTHCDGIISAQFVSNFPKIKGLIAANTYDQLNRSTMYRIREVWRTDFNIEEYDPQTGKGCFVAGITPPKHFNTDGHNYDRYNNIISFDNGAVIYIGSLDNYKSLDGMEIGWAILDETKDTREEAVKEVIVGRLRQKGLYIAKDGTMTTNPAGNEPFNPLYISTSPAKVQWINEWFGLDQYQDEITAHIYSETDYFKKEIGNKLIVISSTYHNLKNLPSNYIENQKANLHSGLQDMLIYGNPFSKAGGEFYKCFNRKENTAEVKYNPSIPLHISWDFNVNPFVTCCVWQIQGKHATQIDEICLPSPNNKTEDTCSEFIRRYRGHNAGLFIYGDPSGKQEDTRTEKGFNDYVIIRQFLAAFRPTLRVANAAPPVKTRGDFINTVFEKGIYGLKFTIGVNCKNSINDYIYLKEASDGTKLKEKVKNNDTGVTYEKYGHPSDANDYLLCYAFAGEFALYQKGGQPVKITTGKNTTKHAY